MVFTHSEERKVVSIINSLNNSSPGCDGIPAILVIRVVNLNIKPLTLITNRTLCDGIIPKELKIRINNEDDQYMV